VIVGKELDERTGVGHTSGSKLQEKEEKKSRNAGCCAGYKPVYEEEIESGREKTRKKEPWVCVGSQSRL
jgi:hypothetical protein